MTDITDKIMAAHKPEIEPFNAALSARQAMDTCERRIWLRTHWAVREPHNWRDEHIEREDRNRRISELRLLGYKVTTTDAVRVSPRVTAGCRNAIVDGRSRYPLMLDVNDEEAAIVAASAEAKEAFVLVEYPGRITLTKVPADEAERDRVANRVERIAQMRMAPANDGKQDCEACPLRAPCRLEEFASVNCRTCARARTHDDGSWTCNARNVTIDNDPESGCPEHILHPSLVLWKLNRERSTKEHAAWDLPDGRVILNGDPETSEFTAFASLEITGDLDACLAQDETVKALREKTNARITNKDH